MSEINCQGQPLNQATGELADALRRLQQLWSSQQTFRATQHAPWIIPADDYGFIECSSCGSSGKVKVVRRTRVSWQQSMQINRSLFSFSAADRSAVFGALNHSLVLYGICESLETGIPSEVLSGFRPATQSRLIAERQVTILYLTPTQLRLITREGSVNLQVRLILCGGGKLDAKTRQLAGEVFPEAAIHEFYGASETSFITLADHQTPVQSVGKAYPGVSIDIRHGVNGIGEVWVNSPYLFEGYVQGETHETRAEGSFVTVGELGWLDNQQNLWLAGRRSRMVTIADKNIFPEAIEAVLLQHPQVHQCAVIVTEDKLRGHILHAWIESPDNPPDQRVLRDSIRQTLGTESVPRVFHFVASLPLLSAGKPDLQKLQAQLK